MSSPDLMMPMCAIFAVLLMWTEYPMIRFLSVPCQVFMRRILLSVCGWRGRPMMHTKITVTISVVLCISPLQHLVSVRSRAVSVRSRAVSVRPLAWAISVRPWALAWAIPISPPNPCSLTGILNLTYYPSGIHWTSHNDIITGPGSPGVP